MRNSLDLYINLCGRVGAAWDKFNKIILSSAVQILEVPESFDNINFLTMLPLGERGFTDATYNPQTGLVEIKKQMNIQDPQGEYVGHVQVFEQLTQTGKYTRGIAIQDKITPIQLALKYCIPDYFHEEGRTTLITAIQTLRTEVPNLTPTQVYL